MKTFITTYEYYGNKITQTVPVIEMISELPDALKIETVIDVLGTIRGNEKLEDFQ